MKKQNSSCNRTYLGWRTNEAYIGSFIEDAKERAIQEFQEFLKSYLDIPPKIIAATGFLRKVYDEGYLETIPVITKDIASVNEINHGEN